MVGASDLAFRLLCRNYGADAVYTEMFYSDFFVGSQAYREEMFLNQIHPKDRPLIVQFCGNNPAHLAEAAKPYCDAIDINLGCPQRRAREWSFGAYLLDEKHWDLLRCIVSSMKKAVKLPIFCKIRILESKSKTIALAQLLEEAGASALVVHGRLCIPEKSEKRRRNGPADLSSISAVVHAVNIPVIANGNVRSASDVIDNLRTTGAAGILSAEGILRDPALFGRVCKKNFAPMPPEQEETDHEKIVCNRCEDNHTAPLIGDLALEYLQLAKEFPPPGTQDSDTVHTITGIQKKPEEDPKDPHEQAQCERQGKGARTKFKFSGKLSTEEIRNKLTNAATLADLEELVRLTLPTSTQEEDAK